MKLSPNLNYVRPENVKSPKKHWKLKEVIYECPTWSAANGTWEKPEKKSPDNQPKDCLAIRWNFNPVDGKRIGYPHAFGRHSQWFIVPNELKNALLERITKILEEEKAK